MSTPLITIVTPTYNRPEMFAECAAAVLAQTFTDWTWWVVVNAWEFPEGYTEIWSTTDDYSKRVDHELWDDPRVQLHWYPVNEAARYQTHVPARIVNWLYPKITTPYIYFLADDDLIDPDGLEVLVDTIEPIEAPSSMDDYHTWAAVKHPCPSCSGSGLYDNGFSCSACSGSGIDVHYSSKYLGSERPIGRKGLRAVYGRCEVVDQQPDGSFAHAAWCFPGPEDATAPFEPGSFDAGLGTAVQPHCLIDGGQVLHTKELWERATADGWQLTDSKADAAANDGTLLNRLAEFARFHYVPQRIVTHRRHAGATHHKPGVLHHENR